VLAFGVTLQMQREQPEVASADTFSQPAAEQYAPEAKSVDAVEPARPATPAPAEKPALAAVKPKVATANLSQAPAPNALADGRLGTAAAPASPSAAPPPASSEAAPMRDKRADAQVLQRAAPEALAKKDSTDADPARELERIAKLRADGRHDEADKALEAFRRDHPGYRIPEAMWERVRPR
jgi:protein TonB